MDSAIAAALKKKSVPALKKALEAKPDLSALNEDGTSALHLAMKLKKFELAQALLAAGAKLDVKDEDQNTPLYALLKSKSGALSATEETNARWLVEKGADLNLSGHYGFTSLHFAARSAKAPLVKFLLEHGAKVLRDEGGATPLLRCITTHSKDEALWELLLSTGCKVSDVDDEKQTIAHRVVTSHNPYALAFFMKKGVDVSLKDGEGKTPLDYATEYKNAKCIALLTAKKQR